MVLQVPRPAYSLAGRIGNRVRDPDGTAAVCGVEGVHGESQSLGRPEKARRSGLVSTAHPTSQKTCLKSGSAPGKGVGAFITRETAAAACAARLFF